MALTTRVVRIKAATSRPAYPIRPARFASVMPASRAALLPLLLSACQPEFTAEQFEQDLFDLQCQMDTCFHDDDGCSLQYVQPRARDCEFDPDLGLDCIDAVHALLDETPEMWVESEDGGAYCNCGDPAWHEYTLDSEECQAMPDPNALPPECDVVCTDLL